jgi:hypothetical protein
MTPATQTKPANPAITEGPGASGRFAKGNPGGPGNSLPRRVAAFRTAMINCITEEDIIAVTKAIIEEAKEGDMAAAKLLFQYVFGQPGSALDSSIDYGKATAEADLLKMMDAIMKAGQAAPKASGSIRPTDECKASAPPKVNGPNG